MANVRQLRAPQTSGISLERFTKAVRPRRGDESCLVPWHSDILALIDQRYTLNQIQEYLAANGVAISTNGISMYVCRWRTKAQAEPKAVSAPRQISTSARTRAKRQMKTRNSRLSDAEICQRNGWGPGTLLAGENDHGVSVIRLTAIGDREVLARHITQNGEPVSELAGRELNWTLTKRDWRRVRSEAR